MSFSALKNPPRIQELAQDINIQSTFQESSTDRITSRVLRPRRHLVDQQGQEKDVLPQHFFQYFGARLVKAGQVTLVQFGREKHRVRIKNMCLSTPFIIIQLQPSG